MPVRRKKPEVESHPEWVRELARVLKEDKEKGSAGEAEVLIEEIGSFHSLHVTVIWDEWTGIEPEVRGRIILDAFKEAGREEEMHQITMAMGVTVEEATRLGVRKAFEG